MGYLVSPYPYHNGTTPSIPVSMVSFYNISFRRQKTLLEVSVPGLWLWVFPLMSELASASSQVLSWSAALGSSHAQPWTERGGCGCSASVGVLSPSVSTLFISEAASWHRFTSPGNKLLTLPQSRRPAKTSCVGINCLAPHRPLLSQLQSDDYESVQDSLQDASLKLICLDIFIIFHKRVAIG